MRITEKFVSLLLQESLNVFYNTDKKNDYKEAVENFMNQRAFDRSVYASDQQSFLVAIRDLSAVGELNFRDN